MARGNLLNTTDITLKGLLANGLRYSVPPYQRDYSWRTEHWDDLWQDVLELAHQPETQHYMGAIVIQPKGREEFVIIDGQQRLCTLSLLVLAAVALLDERVTGGVDPDNNRERIRILRETYLGTKDPGSLLWQSKLALNHNDDTFYQGTLLQLRTPHAPKRLSDSNRLIWEAFCFLRERLKSRYLEPSAGEDIARFINDVVAPRLLFIRVLVDDELSAYTVFETLNARGLDLTASDLLKNYLMALVAKTSEADLRHVLDQWSRITLAIGIRALPEFLRHFLNSQQDFVRQERLFKTIKTQVTAPEKVFGLLDELERASIWYEALGDPQDAQWMLMPLAREQVRVLNLFGVKQYKPLYLAAARRLPEAELPQILRLCVVVSFRATIIADRNPSELEVAYNEAAKGIHTGRLQTVAQVREALRVVAVADEDFRDAFARRSFPASGRTKKIARYILCALERQFDNPDVNDATTPATIEHILPENLGPAWVPEWDDAKHERYVSRLGNLTLLDASRNNDLGQVGYAQKRTTYAQAGYEVTRRISSQEWGPEAIEERQRKMAGWAATVWRL
ncbi:MAG: DUF262 domain-containing protein [Opitutus sp.]|nr:DUF262 domain-containing protein [Opitutus sp.]